MSAYFNLRRSGRGWVLLCLAVSSAWVGANPLSVFVSVVPQQYFVQQIGGERVQVGIMVGPGRVPENYEPTARQMADLEQAALYFRIGMPFEDNWLPRIARLNPRLAIVDHREGLDLLPDSHDHGHDAETRHDPHIWTDPLLVKQIAAQIRDTLSTADPTYHESYAAGYARFAAELEQLDSEIRQSLSSLKQRRFMIFHPDLGYFAKAYGLTQLSIEFEGKEPSARRLAELIEQAQREDLRLIFIQQQYNPRHAQVIAQAVGARVVEINPLAADYPDTLRRIVAALTEQSAGL